MPNPHYRITVDYGKGASPRHFDYSSNEGFAALAEAIDQAAQALDDSLSPASVTITNLGKIAEREALDRKAADIARAEAYGTPEDVAEAICPDCGTPEQIVDAMNASMLKRGGF